MASTAIGPHDFPVIRWRGHWIWVPEERITPGSPFLGSAPPPLPEAHGIFRTTVHLDGAPERVPARITVDARYALFVNGREVSRGPVRSQPRRLHYDLVDLAPYLREGRNVVAVYVKYYGAPTSYWMPAAPNMTLGKTGILAFKADLGAAGWLVSDATWKARKAEAWTPINPAGEALGGIPIEVFDARSFPQDWREAAFDDSAWGQAQVVPAVHIGGFARTQPPTDPYGPLYPRPIAPLGGTFRTPVRVTGETLEGAVATETADPVARVEGAAALSVTATRHAALPLDLDLADGGVTRVTLDMGRIVSGFVEFALEGPAGTTFDLSYTEGPVTGPSGPIGQRAGTRYVARGTDDRFAVFDSNGLRYATVLAHGATRPCMLRAFAVREHIYPWQGGATFECDDADLNRLYAAGVRTVGLCSHDAFIDCPTREQRAWVGDAVVHQMVHLATNTDWRLAWRYLALADSPRPDGILPMSVVGDIEAGGGVTIPDWALHWVHGVYNRYRFDGDRDAVLAALPTVERVLRWYLPYQTADGLLKDVTEWNLVDWSSVMVKDTSAILTAVWALGLREFAEMAAWLEERGRQRWAEGVYERARAGFEECWDEERGSYVDHIVGGVRRPEMSQIAGALAICSGLAPQERWGSIVETITDGGAPGGALLDGGRRGRVRAGENAETVPGHLRARLGCRARDSAGRALHELRSPRRRGPGRPGGPPPRPVSLLAGVPGGRLRYHRRVLGLGHARTRLEMHAHPRPGVLHARGHASRAGLYHGAHLPMPRPPRLGARDRPHAARPDHGRGHHGRGDNRLSCTGGGRPRRRGAAHPPGRTA